MSRKSTLTCIVSDIHFPHHMRAEWAAFREFHSEARPETTIIGGDFLDLAQLSSFSQDPRESVYVIPEIQTFVSEVNALAEECRELVIVEGNHEARWSRFIEPVAIKLKGAIGLTLREQCIAQGLTTRATWYRENAANRGIRVQQFTFRHGDKDFGRFGGGKHPASTLIDKTYGGESPITGHLHQCQLVTRRRADGELLISIQNGTFEKPADYDPKNPWVYSMTLLERCNDRWSTPHPVIIEKGVFAYGGRVYDGNELIQKESAHAARSPDPVISDVMLPSRPPVPFYMPHGDAPPSHAIDRIGEIVEQLERLKTDARESIREFDRAVSVPDTAPQALPPPAPAPRGETPTRDELHGSRMRQIEHPVTKELATIASWARRLGVARTTLVYRLDRVQREERNGTKSYTLEDALTQSGTR